MNSQRSLFVMLLLALGLAIWSWAGNGTRECKAALRVMSRFPLKGSVKVTHCELLWDTKTIGVESKLDAGAIEWALRAIKTDPGYYRIEDSVGAVRLLAIYGGKTGWFTTSYIEGGHGSYTISILNLTDSTLLAYTGKY